MTIAMNVYLSNIGILLIWLKDVRNLRRRRGARNSQKSRPKQGELRFPADDVERLQQSQPVEAGPPSLLFNTRKAVRRNRGPTITGSTGRCRNDDWNAQTQT